MRKTLLLGACVATFAFAAGVACADGPDGPSSPGPRRALRPSHYNWSAARRVAPLCASPKCQWSLAPLSDGNTGDYSQDI